MPKVVVKDNHLNFGGVTYFRGHAEEVEIGSYGEKRSPWTKMNYLEVKARIPVDKIDVATSTIAEIDFAQTTRSSFGAQVVALISGVPVKLKGDVTFDKLQKGELKLVKFSVMVNTMKAAANKSPVVLEDLRNFGNNARIAHQVFVVIEEKVATVFDNNARVGLSGGVGAIKATVDHSTKGVTTVDISAGTSFAYLLAKIDWGKKKEEIEDLDDDQWSFS